MELGLRLYEKKLCRIQLWRRKKTGTGQGTEDRDRERERLPDRLPDRLPEQTPRQTRFCLVYSCNTLTRKGVKNEGVVFK